jgi:hypothetical protein
MANGNISLNVSPDTIIGSEVMKSGEYKYASVGIKVSDDEYIRISYEWKGDSIPEFVMGIMSWIQSNKEQVEEHKEEYASLKERI